MTGLLRNFQLPPFNQRLTACGIYSSTNAYKLIIISGDLGKITYSFNKLISGFKLTDIKMPTQKPKQKVKELVCILCICEKHVSQSIEQILVGFQNLGDNIKTSHQDHGSQTEPNYHS